VNAVAEPAPAAELAAEAGRLVGAADDAGLRLRLMGGIAIWLSSPSVRVPPYARTSPAVGRGGDP
jgi:hypothetical protein